MASCATCTLVRRAPKEVLRLTKRQSPPSLKGNSGFRSDDHRVRDPTGAAWLVHKLHVGLDPGDTILMDAGTTVVEMAPHLAGIAHLTVVTSALNVALEVGAATSARVILLGGELSREASCTRGSLTQQTLADFSVQKFFLGTQALDLESGLTDTTLEIAELKRAMIRSARSVYLLCAAEKWDTTGFIKVAPLTAVQTVITDKSLSPAARKSIQRLGLKLLFA